MIDVLFDFVAIIANKRAHFQVFQYGHARKDTPRLRHQRHALAHDIAWQHTIDASSLKLYCAVARTHQSKDRFHRRRFARCICSKQANDFTFVDFE